MKKANIFIFLFLLVFSNTQAQTFLPTTWVDNFSKANNFNIRDRENVFGREAGKQFFDNGYFWDDEYNQSMIWLYPNGSSSSLQIPDSIFCKQVRIDIWNNEIELVYSTGVKALPCNLVENMVVLNDKGKFDQYLNPAQFGMKEVKGLVRVLGEKNKKAILATREIWVKKPTFNAAMQTGNKESELVPNDKFFYWDGTKLSSIDGKKEIEDLLTSFGFDSKKYLKESKNKLKEIEDYKKFAFYLFQ